MAPDRPRAAVPADRIRVFCPVCDSGALATPDPQDRLRVGDVVYLRIGTHDDGGRPCAGSGIVLALTVRAVLYDAGHVPD